MGKELKLTEPMRIRWIRQGREWNAYKCLICGKMFKSDDCPHSFKQNQRANELLRDREGII